MRHHNSVRKFNRVRKQRVALLNSLARSLVLKEKIKTTETKAKELRPFAEKLITRGKLNTLSSVRFLVSKVGKTAAKKVVDELSPKYKSRKGGYTRITKLAVKRTDGANSALIEFV